MKEGKWIGAALLLALCCGRSVAGEFTIGYQVGGTRLEVDGDRLSSGNSVNDKLMMMGLRMAYRWSEGPFAEFGIATSFNPFPIFGWDDVHHASLAGGWQFDLGHELRFTPKAGLVHSSLESSEEDFFDGDEPVDKIKKVVPFIEVALERRFFRHMGLGLFLRENFEDFGASQSYGLSISWTFD
jgi:hypothetical protein